MFRPYILLKDIDGKPYWRPYGGEPLEDLRKYHEWELNAQRHFKDKVRPQEDLDFIRNSLLALSHISELLGITDNPDDDGGLTFSDMLDSVVLSIAIRWYCKDNGNIDYHKVPHEVTIPDEDLKVYYQLVMFYATNFVNTINTVRMNVDSSTQN